MGQPNRKGGRVTPKSRVRDVDLCDKRTRAFQKRMPHLLTERRTKVGDVEHVVEFCNWCGYEPA